MIDEKEFRNYAVNHLGMSGLSVDDYLREANRPNGMTRTVIEERPMPFREVDVFSRLMMDRIIFLGLAIDDFIANIIQAQLLFLESSEVLFTLAWESTIRCSTSVATLQRSARAWLPQWEPLFYALARKASVRPSSTRG